VLQFESGNPGRLAHAYYNFSSAAGINYMVDVSKDPGERVYIQSFSDGSPFQEMDAYEVALNSYRGNGGGGHLTSGAGIPPEELSSRILWSTDRDLRYHLMVHLGSQDTLQPALLDNWHCIPKKLAQEAIRSDRRSMEEALGF
jgi:2',3'-cyclic-nucleotide 2'-phosphodiesterase/3'-nucleotidase